MSDLSPGIHEVECSSLDGWVTPANKFISISGGATSSVTLTYVKSTANVVVFLIPTNAVAVGAQWRIDDGSWRNSGSNVTIVSGTHQLIYNNIPAWIAPSNETCYFSAFTTTSLTRVYLADTKTDTDGDGLLDAWEIHWFGSLAHGAADDPDGDSLENMEEFQVAQVYTSLDKLSPMDFDSDGDGMDDRWEYDRYLRGVGLNPCSNDDLARSRRRRAPEHPGIQRHGWSAAI